MLELSHISKTYKTSKGIKTHALKDINLKFPKQGMVFVLGKSGSGKSTLLNVIGGLDQADQGEVIIHGKSSQSFTQADYDAYRNTYIGFIFQEFYLMEEYTIEKNIALSLQLQQKTARPEDIEAILTKVGLSGYGSRYPNELSGGQKQRVAIARSLIKEPEILMADEPTGALDSTTGKEIFDTLKELSKEKLVIVVSHDEEAAKTYADRIITFADGEVIEDTNPTVEASNDSFIQIKSHLPFKDSFHLGITCLKHKKIRMVFTILLTSFALLTLALSDSVGQFNGVDAQYKAMQDHNEHIVGIQRQLMDGEGEPMRGWVGMNLNPISSSDAANVTNKLGGKVAKVYDSQEQSISLSSMGISTLDLNTYTSAIEKYYLAEMSSFADMNYEDTLGTYPKDHSEVAISSYLADSILENGIKDENGKLIRPSTYEDIMGKIKLPIAGKWLTVSGIVKQDLSQYDALKDIPQNQLDEESYKLYRIFYAIVNRDCQQLFVANDFIASLDLKKGNLLQTNMGSITFEKNGNFGYTHGFSYPTEEVSYYDGETMQTIYELAKDEALINVDVISNYLNTGMGGGGIYSEEFSNLKTDAEREAFIKELVQPFIGTKLTASYSETYDESGQIFKQEVTVKGVILPESYGDDQVYMVSPSYVAKELIEPYIVEPYYLGEIMTSAQGSQLKEMLGNYTIDDEFSANTIATNDVQNVKSFAEFATQVFFWASIAFFFFAAALLMNFIVVSISYRKKEIGILRSIGARSKDVMKIFVWEALVLALISYVVTIVALYGLSFLVNSFAMDTVGILISPVILTLRQPLMLMLIVLAIAFLASFLPILRIARQRPIDAIKK